MPTSPPEGAVPPPRRRSATTIAGWALVGLALLGQYVLFRGYVEREIAWGYPRLWDQAALLAKAYSVHDVWQRDGGAVGLATAWSQRPVNGALVLFEVVPLMRLLGPSRLTALSLNFLHYALFQVALVAALRRLAPGWTAAALGLGLWLALRGPSGFGGLFDFRLDFMALCLQGLWLCLALRCDSLARPRGLPAAAALAAALGLLRHITLAYTTATLLAFAVVELLVGRGAGGQGRARARGALAVLGLLGLVGGPVLWLGRSQLRAYYWVGHVEKGEELARWVGIATRLDAWLYYPRSLRDDHLGALGLALVALALLAGAGVWSLSRRRLRPAPGLPPDDLGAAARLLGCATLCPLAVLSLDTAKSPIVAGLVLPALVLLATLPAVFLLRHAGGRRALPALAALTLAAGLGHTVSWLRGPGPLNVEAADSRAITSLHETIARLAIERGWPRPLVLVGSSEEYTVRWNTSVVAFERYGRLIEPRLPLGGLPWTPVTEEQFRRHIGLIQMAFVAREPPAPGLSLPPFDQSMAQLRPLVLATCEREFLSAGRFRIHGKVIELFVRPERRGVSGYSR